MFVLSCINLNDACDRGLSEVKCSSVEWGYIVADANPSNVVLGQGYQAVYPQERTARGLHFRSAPKALRRARDLWIEEVFGATVQSQRHSQVAHLLPNGGLE